MSLTIRTVVIWLTVGALIARPHVLNAQAWQENVFVSPALSGNAQKDVMITRGDSSQWQVRLGLGCKAAIMQFSPDQRYSGTALLRGSAGDPFDSIIKDSYNMPIAHLLFPLTMGEQAGAPLNCRVLSVEPYRAPLNRLE